MLNKLSLNTIGLNRIGLNRIGKFSRGAASGSDRPYIDPEVLASLKAVCICYGKSNDDPDRAIVKNLVDPDNPFIISNAAYKLNSGYGLYAADFTTWTKVEGVETTSHGFRMVGEVPSAYWILFLYNTIVPSCKIRVSGIPEGGYLKYNRSVILKNGINEIPEMVVSAGASGFTRSLGTTQISDWIGLSVEQIPSYQGAFVTDGVDDLITSTKTVQDMLGGSNEITVVSMIHQVKDSTNNVSFTNYIRGSANGYFRNIVNNYDKTGIYGYTSSDLMGLSVVNNILGDKNDYTSNGDNRDTIINGNFSVQGYSYNNSNNTGDFSSVAWYWTVIANKVLTTDQINQVIAYYNLDRCVEPTVLYDVKRQGLSNDTPDSDWYLKDFSKNGFDMSLFNFAKKENSGVGKYETDFLDSSIWKYKTNSSVTSDKIVCNKAATHIMLLYYSITDGNKYDVPSFNVLKQGDASEYYYINEQGTRRTFKLLDGINTLPASHGTLFTGTEATCGFGNPGIGNSVTITQIPSHAGALCSDGVNDYGKVTGLPIYKDYTVIADYERISGIDNAWTGALVSKAYAANQGAFILMETNGLAKHSYSFGTTTTFNKDDSTRTLLYQSKYKCGDVDLNAGTGIDGDTLWLGTYRDNYSSFFNGAIYSLMSFPYSMSEFLIERQLKKHKLGTLYPDMVEFRPIVKSNLPYSSISYSVNPGEYISVDSMVTITVTLPNTSDKLMEVSCNAISDISISGDNGVYEITGKIVKSPQKINLVISSYLTMLNNETLISNETLIKNE